MTMKKSKMNRLWTIYRLRREDYDKLMEDAGGACIICFERGRLQIDHDHATNAIRGMICNRCNKGLALFNDDPEILSRAVAYLRRKPIIPSREPPKPKPQWNEPPSLPYGMPWRSDRNLTVK